MRIRTVKPEFWTNERMANQPEFTRLLALALLNYADDHGYFWSNPTLIRGAVFPFVEDSSRIRRSLAQLVQIGYLSIGKAPDGREGGKIVSFKDHQKIDRPRPSVIQPFISFDEASPTLPGLVDEPSLLDRKGREQGKEGKGTVGSAAASPRALPSLDEWLTEAKQAHPDWPRDDAESAWNYYEAAGWKRGKNLIVKWRACIATCYGNWAKANPARPGSSREFITIPPEPDGWRTWLDENIPGTVYGREGALEGIQWRGLPDELRNQITKGINP